MWRNKLAAPFFFLCACTIVFAEEMQNSGSMVSVMDVEEAKKWGNRVYLATYPRSGSHWMRYLIEEATGIATSSAYIDPDPRHLETVFPWGGYCCDGGYEGHCRYPMMGEIAIVKTHFPDTYISGFEKLPYSLAVRIIRHPIDSFYSLYLWEKSCATVAAEFLIPREILRQYNVHGIDFRNIGTLPKMS